MRKENQSWHSLIIKRLLNVTVPSSLQVKNSKGLQSSTAIRLTLSRWQVYTWRNPLPPDNRPFSSDLADTSKTRTSESPAAETTTLSEVFGINLAEKIFALWPNKPC